MKSFYYFLTIILISAQQSMAQEPDFSINEQIIDQLPEEVQIIGLGDPTHQESTITKFRIDLIKKLVLEKDYKIIAIEGNLFELHQAHVNFLIDGNIIHYERAMYSMLNAKEMETLYAFVDQQNSAGNPVQIVGFDTDFSGETFPEQLAPVLNKANLLTVADRADFVAALEKAHITNFKALFRNDQKLRQEITAYATKVLDSLQPKSTEEHFLWQAMNNLAFLYSDEVIADKRDVGMGRNIAFLQEAFPGQKIILFGSSTHLLKDPKAIQTPFFQRNRETTLGQELSKSMGDNYYFVGYSAISGSTSNWKNEATPLAPLDTSAIEFQLSQQTEKPVFFLTKKNMPMEAMTLSRFLGHHFIPLNLWDVMDGLVLIREVKPFKIKKL